MHATQNRPLDLSNLRYWRQNAERAVRDVYDALVELITNADDRYVILGKGAELKSRSRDAARARLMSSVFVISRTACDSRI
jgi:hypothetical protein